MTYPFLIMAIADDEDRWFMQRVYEDYHNLMYCAARKLLKGSDQVDDAVNNAFLSLINNVKTLHGLDVCMLRAYIVSSTRSACYDILRKQSRIERRTVFSADDALADTPSGGPDVDDRLIRDAEIEELMEGLRNLNDRDRNILEMKYFQRRTDADIAAAHGIKPASVRQYLTLARRRLADEMAKRSLV